MSKLNFIKKEFTISTTFIIFLFLNTIEIYSQNTLKKINELLDNRYEEYNLNIRRIDSAIYLTKELNDNKILGDIYFQKAAYIYSNKKYNEALEYYIKANKISKDNDEYVYYSSLYGIAVIKQQLGDYKESIKMLEECFEYFYKNKDNTKFTQAYIVTTSRLSYLYIKTKNLNKSFLFSKLEFQNSKTKLDSSYAYKNLGILEFYNNNYKRSIECLDKAEAPILQKNDISWYMTIQSYKGENYLKEEKQKEANLYFNKVVSLFNETKIVNNDIRVSFERLINYYNNIDDKENQLKIINNILVYDSVFFSTNRTLSKSYFKKYENSQLLEERNLLMKENKLSKIVFTIVFILIFTVFIFFYLKNKKEKKKLLIYINNNIDNNINNNITEIDPIIEDKLILFEKGTIFTNNNFDLEYLSQILGYNRSIVSNYINRTRKKNFNQYINSLRIKYLVKRLIEEEKLRNLTIDALAEECGFNSRKTFANSFILYTGFKPSFFIKNLKYTVPDSLFLHN